MTAEHVRTEVDGAIAFVEMRRPPVNALDLRTYEELRATFASPTWGPEVRAVVLSGAGTHFCAGNDLHDFATMTSANGGERMRLVRETFFAVSDLPLPVVAAVSGVALGSGLALAASCDLIVASEDARFGLPELSVGVMGGARHLARIAPPALVRRAFLTADPIPAAELAAVGGIASLVATPGEVRDAAVALLGRVLRHGPIAVSVGKRVLGEIETMDLKPGYEHEQGLTVELADTHDSKEALAAFFEGREPRFLGA